MADGFNRYITTGITTSTVVTTCPSDTVITLIGITVSNTTGVTTDVSVRLNAAHILKNVTIYEGSAIVPVGGEQKIVMVAGDELIIEATNAVDAIVSALEQTI